MPKNRFGGKNAKKMANKRTEGYGGETSRLVVPEHEDEYIGRVTKRCGDGRFVVDYVGDNGKTEGVAKVPGSLRKITRTVREGSYVLFQRWGFSDADKKGSILHLYSEQEVLLLTHSGALGGIEEMKEKEETVLIDSVASAQKLPQEEKDLLDWDAI